MSHLKSHSSIEVSITRPHEAAVPRDLLGRNKITQRPLGIRTRDSDVGRDYCPCTSECTLDSTRRYNGTYWKKGGNPNALVGIIGISLYIALRYSISHLNLYSSLSGEQNALSDRLLPERNIHLCGNILYGTVVRHS